MIEIPEALVLSKQLDATIIGKTIATVVVGDTPHKFTWYFGEPEKYQKRLQGKVISKTEVFGNFLEISLDDVKILFHEGVNLRFLKDGSDIPKKHQLLVTFEDDSVLVASVRMYGGIGCFPEGELDNKYYVLAKEKPSPISDGFDWQYFSGLISDDLVQKLSVKAILATEQRIPGLGNGVLQDILFNARIHPKHRVNALTDKQIGDLFRSVKSTLNEMVVNGGRDTEMDLFSQPGGYKTKMSKNTVGTSCGVCGSMVKKASYMGGSIYFCRGCQPI